MRPGISYTSQGNPYMKNPGTFAFSQAQPKSSDKQQGPLAEPPKQSNQAAQKQFGSAQASGDYSAYSPRGDYSAYSPEIATPEYWASQRNQQYPTQGRQQYGGMQAGWPAGYTGPGSSPMERMPIAVDGPPSNPAYGGFTPDSPAWSDPRNDAARNRYYQQLQQYNDYQASQGNNVPVYAAQQAPPQQPQRYVFPLQGQGQQFYNQRDAFINNINTSLGQQMMQNFGGATPVAPQLNIPQLWAQAGQMAADGWTNPLAALIGNV